MGASESKLVFKQGIFRLSEEQEIPADDPYWTRVSSDAKIWIVYEMEAVANYPGSSGSYLNPQKMSLAYSRRRTYDEPATMLCPTSRP